jgi:hypothetical protein
VAGLQGHSVPHPLDHEELLHEVVQRTRHDGTSIHTGPQDCQTCRKHTVPHVEVSCLEVSTLARRGGTLPYDAFRIWTT